MGIGAVFAAMNTMYAMLANRTREVGTLRVLGFSRGFILLAFILEGLFLTVAGGALGCLLSFLMNGTTASTAGSMGEVSFAFRVTRTDLGYGLLFAATMGVLGSLLPAARAAHMPMTSALPRGEPSRQTITSNFHSLTRNGLLGNTERRLRGGGRGIRTPGTVSRTSVFKTDCFNHSHIPPQSARFRF